LHQENYPEFEMDGCKAALRNSCTSCLQSPKQYYIKLIRFQRSQLNSNGLQYRLSSAEHVSLIHLEIANSFHVHTRHVFLIPECWSNCSLCFLSKTYSGISCGITIDNRNSIQYANLWRVFMGSSYINIRSKIRIKVHLTQDQPHPGKPRAAHKGTSRRLRSLRRGISEHPPVAPGNGGEARRTGVGFFEDAHCRWARAEREMVESGRHPKVDGDCFATSPKWILHQKCQHTARCTSYCPLCSNRVCNTKLPHLLFRCPTGLPLLRPNSPLILAIIKLGLTAKFTPEKLMLLPIWEK